MVAAGRGNDAGGWQFARLTRQQYAVEGAARLEAAGVLEQFKLQHQRMRQAEIFPCQPQHRRAADMRRDALMRGQDRLPVDGLGGRGRGGVGGSVHRRISATRVWRRQGWPCG
jgi:hypothetical protein